MNLIPFSEGAVIVSIKGGIFLIDKEDLSFLDDSSWYVRRDNHTHQSYVCSFEDGHVSVLLHRVLLDLRPGDGILGDHINGCTMDNRRVNLRKATTTQNVWNSRRQPNSGTGFVGVRKVANGFSAKIRTNYVDYNLGVYDTPEEASAAYQNKRAELDKLIFPEQS